MAIQTASVLYLSNSTTVDSGTGIDIRLLADTFDGTGEYTTSVRFTHTQDNVNRTFDPATSLVTTVADPHSFQGEGWALRLTDDMTPVDDTNCNAVLTAGTITARVEARCNMNGGTNLGGTTNFTFKVSLWKYDPVANTGTVIATGSQGNSWNTAALGDNNTYKVTNVSIVISDTVEFAQGEILLYQVGVQSGTLPNASVGTTNFDVNLSIGLENHNRLNFDTGQGIAQVCFMTGASSGLAAASGAAVPVYPTTGSSAGIATVAGSLEAEKETTGTSSGTATTGGVFVAVKEVIGSSAGVATVSGVPSIVVPTTGTVTVSEGGGGTTVIENYVFSVQE